MADATIKGWCCDVCGKVYRENDFGYLADYSLLIESNGNPDYSGYADRYNQVCVDCMDKISTCIMRLRQ